MPISYRETAHGYHANCELGTLHLQYATEGPVDVLIRPENVKVKPAPGTSETRVREILFFGHDQLVALELASGRSLATRVGPMYNFVVGQPVSIEVTGLVMAYPGIEQR